MCPADVPVVLLGPVWGDDEQLVDLAVRQLVVGVLLHALGEPAHHQPDVRRKTKS
jgi:hypothetical protein